MTLLSAIFGRRVTPDVRAVNRPAGVDISSIDGKDVITADPDRPLPKSSRRPPIIFENGRK